ncbi:MAG: AIR synthase-related protein, partial [Bryobacteraceae bacterium]
AHDLSDGGLAIALAECSFGPVGAGASVDLDSSLQPELLLFHEGPSRILLSTSQPGLVLEIAARHGVEAARIGTTIKERIEIRCRGSVLVADPIARFHDAWSKALESYVR